MNGSGDTLRSQNPRLQKKLIDCYGLNESERKVWDVPFYERLLDNGFQERFFDSLSAEDKKKVQINREMM